jgi:hypothetical protein
LAIAIESGKADRENMPKLSLCNGLLVGSADPTFLSERTIDLILTIDYKYRPRYYLDRVLSILAIERNQDNRANVWRSSVIGRSRLNLAKSIERIYRSCCSVQGVARGQCHPTFLSYNSSLLIYISKHPLNSTLSIFDRLGSKRLAITVIAGWTF